MRGAAVGHTWMANRPSWPTAKKGANMPNEEATAKLSTSIRALYMHHTWEAYHILQHAGRMYVIREAM